MQYPQEDYACELSDRLVQRFPRSADVTVEINGKGTNSKCRAKRQQRLAVVHCFHYRLREYRGPEFLIVFKDVEQKVAAGRTRSIDEAERAVQCWLDGQSLSSLYDHFAFVDKPERELTHILTSVTKAFPELQKLSTELQKGLASPEFRSLWFRTHARSCHIYLRNDVPQASCKWDDCEMFRHDVDDLSQFGAVLKRWLCEDVQPSEMRKEFPWLSIGEIAEYYERGNPIEGEFLHSWNWVERSYVDDFHFPSRTKVLHFLRQLRQAGYDSRLRAGQSMWAFVVSRSRRHGLPIGQPRIIFEFHDKDMIVAESDGIETRSFEGSIELSGPVKTVIERLTGRGIE